MHGQLGALIKGGIGLGMVENAINAYSDVSANKSEVNHGFPLVKLPFLEIIMRCRSRLVKHTKVLERMLRFVDSHGSNQFNAPQTVFPDDKVESLQDIELLGEYCGATHKSYMRLYKHRLK